MVIRDFLGSEAGSGVLAFIVLTPLAVFVFGEAMAVTVFVEQLHWQAIMFRHPQINWHPIMVWCVIALSGVLGFAGVFVALQRINGNREGLSGWWRRQKHYPARTPVEPEPIKFVIEAPPELKEGKHHVPATKQVAAAAAHL